MKKQINKNFILSLTLVGMLLLVIVLGIVLQYEMNTGIDGLRGDIESVRSRDEIGDVEGYGMIANGIGYGLGMIGMVLVWVFLIIIPGILAAFIFIFALLAKLIYQNNPQRILAYRILMGFSYAGQIIMLLVSLPSLAGGGWESLITLIISGYIFWAIFMGMRGT